MLLTARRKEKFTYRWVLALAVLRLFVWPSSALAEPNEAYSNPGTDASPPGSQTQPSPAQQSGEVYVGGFGGYTFDTGSGLQGTGLGALAAADVGLKDSGVVGAKIGYFMPGRVNWLGIELEGFYTTPHVKAATVTPAFPLPFPVPGVTVPGAHLQVTTVALNFIARAQLACRSVNADRLSERTTSEPSHADNRRRFCALQPYVGAGPGVYYARISNQFGSNSGATVGLNALAGIRYFFTEHVALFGEYKYNRASFSFDNIDGTGAGLDGTYSVSHVVGGLSLHF